MVQTLSRSLVQETYLEISHFRKTNEKSYPYECMKMKNYEMLVEPVSKAIKLSVLRKASVQTVDILKLYVSIIYLWLLMLNVCFNLKYTTLTRLK